MTGYLPWHWGRLRLLDQIPVDGCLLVFRGHVACWRATGNAYGFKVSLALRKFYLDRGHTRDTYRDLYITRM